MSNTITLQYGDIIEIDSPSNNDLHNQIYFINFINNEKIVIINDKDKKILLISDEGTLLEETIENIFLLHRQPSKSFLIQNNIQINTYLSIYFGGKLPTIVNGIVTNIDEDMMELTTIPTNEVIYIDFAYSGIPEDLNIEKIIINKDKPIDETELFNETELEEDEITQNQYLKDIDETLDNDLQTYNDIYKMNEILLDDFELDDNVEEFYHNVNVPENEKRYTLETQINDYMNVMLNKYKPEERTEKVINMINLEINRYKELRNKFSIFDINNNASLPDSHDEYYKPLKQILYKWNKKLYWLLPVFNGIKKIIVNSNGDIDEDNKNVNTILFSDLIKNFNDILTKWKKNTSKDSINTYKNYINKLLELFNNTSINNQDLQSNLMENNIHEINTNITAINDTNDDIYNNLYSYVSNVNKSDIFIEKKKFVFEVFDTGNSMLETQIINNKIHYKLKNLTNNDKINIISFLTMPYSYFLFSKINMDYTNIYDRSNLNNIFINYFTILNEKSNIERYIYSDIQNKHINTHTTINNNNLLSNISNFSIDDSIDLNYDEKYELLLESFIPTNNVLIKLIFKNKDYYNIKSIINDLQSFNIDIENIINVDYNLLKNLMISNINKYVKNYKLDKTNLLKLLEEININNKEDKFLYSFNLLSKDIKSDIFNFYNINEDIFLSNNEFINYLYTKDNGIFFINALNKNIMDLIISNLLDTFVNQKNKNDKKENKEDKCEKYFLSKKYTSIQELENDNNKLIFFDAIYDNTLYSFINEYENEKNTMDKKKFITFLTNKISDKLNFTNENAKREAIAIIEEKKEVLNGDYAILVDKNTNKNYIYIRKNNIWELDKKFQDFFIDNNKILCDINKDCISIKDKCMSVNKFNKLTEKEDIEKILSSFESEYNLSVENIKAKLNDNYEFYKKYLLNCLKINKYKDEYVNRLYEKYNSNFDINIQKSPYEKLKDKIFEIPDFNKRFYYIKKFCLKYTRFALESEEPYWLYCIQTNIKLIPRFLLKLANVYENNIEYNQELDNICAEQGSISDDNSYWVDKYSGYIIKKIEFSTEEGYDEKGFKLYTKEMLENDLTLNINIEKEDNVTKTIKAIINTIMNMIGINTFNYNELIIKNVKLILSTELPDKKKYEKMLLENKQNEKKKANKSYEELYNQLILLLTLSYITAYLQLNIPSIITKKTFPGCIKSFKGYPFGDSEDKSTLIYISCITNKIKSSIEPWNTILNLSESSIAKKIELFINKYIINDKDYLELVEKKKLYLNDKEEDIPEYLNIDNWTTFMPPLIHLDILNTNIQPLPEEFINDLHINVKKTYNIIDIIKSKNIYLSNKIIELIQKVIKKKTPLLQSSVGEPYLENACCNSNLITINYFIENDKNIMEYNNLVNYNLNLINTLNKFNKASYIYHPKNTRLSINNISNDFNEMIIYKFFIYYCNFNNNLSIDDDIKNICMDKPILYNNIDTIEEYINSIKAEGRVYDKNSFNNLLNLINNRNLLQINIENTPIKNIEILRDILLKYNELTSDNIDEKFTELLYNLIDTYTIEKDNEYIDDIINYLSDVNKLMKSNILQFFKKNASSSKIYKEFEIFMNIEIDENNTYFYKNYIHNFLYVFPELILKKSINFNDIPQHWNLTEKHNEDIQNIIQSYYEFLYNIQDSIDLNIIFDFIKNKLDILYKIIQNIYYIKPLNINNDKNNEIISIFDKDFIIYLYKYIFYSIFNEYINITNNSILKLELDDDFDETLLNNKITEIMYAFMKIYNNHNNIININYKKVKEKVSYAKEKEKSTFTDYFKNLSDEERQVQNLFKINKLEDWSIGLQKGLTQYVGENYDKEKEKLIKQVILEKKLQKVDNVTEMNAEIYKLDLENDDETQKLVDDEYDIKNVVDDDDPDVDLDNDDELFESYGYDIDD